MRADFAISGGPADIARAILVCGDSVSSAEEIASNTLKKQIRSLILRPPLAGEQKTPFAKTTFAEDPEMA
jgi:hypothetical protein